MTKWMIPLVLVTAFAFSPVAFAAGGDKPAATDAATQAKRDACKAEWQAQTTHTQERKDFMQACMAK